MGHSKFIVSNQYKEPINNKGLKYQENKLTFCFPVEKCVMHFGFSSIVSLFKMGTSLKGKDLLPWGENSFL